MKTMKMMLSVFVKHAIKSCVLGANHVFIAIVAERHFVINVVNNARRNVVGCYLMLEMKAFNVILAERYIVRATSMKLNIIRKSEDKMLNAANAGLTVFIVFIVRDDDNL